MIKKYSPEFVIEEKTRTVVLDLYKNEKMNRNKIEEHSGIDSRLIAYIIHQDRQELIKRVLS